MPTQPIHAQNPPSRQAASARGPLPATGVVLIGTVGTLRALSGQIDGTMPGVVPAGCVLVEGGTVAEAWAHGRTRDLPPVLGGLDQLVELHARMRFRLALISLPAGMETHLRRIEHGLARLGLEHRTVPTLDAILSAPRVTAAPARAPVIDPAELIGRTHYGLDHRAVATILAGKRVVITGAGGSIGGELARVAAGFGPQSITLLERSENALFTIDHQLARRFPGVARKAVLHDVVDEARTLALLREHRPHVVFHAAAHKHVPLMEDHPSAAIDNNLFGTRSIADASAATGAERFVMISSDKAVNPTSVMGATKRLAEMYIAALARDSARAGSTRFSMVRFGNVLASACSVVPIWQEQIASGGPVTVTDPRMTRFFMTIPEAATLVAQAAALTGADGAAPVYVLDMGEPIRILDLAIRLVRAHGFEPRLGGSLVPGAAPSEAPGLEIAFTGVRPGEKLHEELAYAAENLRPSGHPGINCWAGQGGGHEEAQVETARRMVAELGAVRRAGETSRAHVLDLIRKWVPEMRPG
ncbi:MAG: polysaccharide biosynthesis protein [Phycisphaerales bacterium]